MGSLKPSQVRRRIASSIQAQLGEPWHESSHSFDQFPGQDSSAILDGCYAVGLGETRPITEDGRQRRSRGLVVVTEVRVRVSATTVTTNQAADYERALDMEQRALWAVMATGKDPDLEVVYVSTGQRQNLQQGTLYLAEMRFEVRHLLALA